ncbi:hypothetical protein NEOKW01_0885 [Nematocida sp. AWRm80]|nr:hypothetical protein NEOKW01_0885 [Nematocida sp. AWRm80]
MNIVIIVLSILSIRGMLDIDENPPNINEITYNTPIRNLLDIIADRLKNNEIPNNSKEILEGFRYKIKHCDWSSNTTKINQTVTLLEDLIKSEEEPHEYTYIDTTSLNLNHPENSYIAAVMISLVEIAKNDLVKQIDLSNDIKRAISTTIEHYTEKNVSKVAQLLRKLKIGLTSSQSSVNDGIKSTGTLERLALLNLTIYTFIHAALAANEAITLIKHLESHKLLPQIKYIQTSGCTLL